MEKEVKEGKKCLLEEARKRLIEEQGERGRNTPLYISCPCPKCTPSC